MSVPERTTTGERAATAVLGSGGITPTGAVRLAAAVADEVAALHAASQVHGRLGLDAVRIAGDGRVRLVGAGGRPTIGAADASVTRSSDLRAVGRLLTAALGVEGTVPRAVQQLIGRAQRTDAPAAALAAELHALARDPLACARLIPAPTPVSSAQAARWTPSLLAALIPAAERRSTGIAASVLTVLLVVGITLLLVGSPGSTTRPGGGQAVAAEQPVPKPTAEADPEPAEDAPPAALDDRVAAMGALLGDGGTTARTDRGTAVTTSAAGTAPAPASVAPAPRAPAAVRPTTRPTPSATSAPTGSPAPAPTAPPATTAPAPSAPVSTAPPAPPAPAPSAPAAPAPAASATPAPAAPVPSAVPTAVPAAPRSPAAPSAAPAPTAAVTGAAAG